MKTHVSGLALLALACAAPPSAKRADPIPAELLCSGEATQSEAALADVEECKAAVANRLNAMQRAVLRRWTSMPAATARSAVQVQFTLDAEGRPRDVCVLGGTGEREAREALTALAKFRPRAPLGETERCVLGVPLVSTFTTERRP